MSPPRKMSFQCVTLKSSLYYLVEIKSSGAQCLGTAIIKEPVCMTPLAACKLQYLYSCT
ncbi:hypothetical protein wVul_0593 [Wolbachia endosymbiont of Armadillidium vulgare str. wVulC]|nr:hypothetical protein wVul_0593 [Wolbachia endosymbiont of Armadillidium vulgare str. wVulC]